jgi:hypothetical protein
MLVMGSEAPQPPPSTERTTMEKESTEAQLAEIRATLEHVAERVTNMDIALRGNGLGLVTRVDRNTQRWKVAIAMLVPLWAAGIAVVVWLILNSLGGP